MDCICVYDGDYDGEIASFFSESKPKARKAHKCCECSRTIERGEVYIYESGLWEGNFESYKTCEDCISIRKAFFNCGFVFTMMFEDLAEFIDETGGQLQGAAIKSLTPNARDKVLGMVQEYIDDYDD